MSGNDHLPSHPPTLPPPISSTRHDSGVEVLSETALAVSSHAAATPQQDTRMHRHSLPSFRMLAAGALIAAAPLVPGPTVSAQTLDSLTLAGFRWRTVAPANFEGRTADIAGIPSPSKTFFIAAAAGGIWKTTNNGVTYRPVFDTQRCVSMGALA